MCQACFTLRSHVQLSQVVGAATGYVCSEKHHSYFLFWLLFSFSFIKSGAEDRPCHLLAAPNIPAAQGQAVEIARKSNLPRVFKKHCGHAAESENELLLFFVI